MSSPGSPFPPRIGGPDEVSVSWVDQPPPGRPPGNRRPLLIAAAAVVVVGAVVTGIVVTRDAGTGSSTGPAGPTTGPRAGVTGPTILLPTDLPTSPATTTTTPPTTGRPDFGPAARTAARAVVRVFASTCQGTGVGSGFWIDDSTVITSYPSVARSVSTVVVDPDRGPIVATVSGADPATGVAVLTTEAPGSGAVLSVGSSAPAEGDSVAVVGVPGRRSGAAASTGRVGAGDISLRTHGTAVSGLVAVSGRSDLGLAGAPVVDVSGSVVGVVYADAAPSRRLMVPAASLSSGVQAASASGPPAAGRCARPEGPGSQTVVSGSAPKAMRKGLTAYFGGINSGDWARAYAAMGPRYHVNGSPRWPSTFDFDIRVRSVKQTSAGWRAWVTFTSLQSVAESPQGSGYTCARWSFDYLFSRDGDRLEINDSVAHGGRKTAWVPC